MKPPPAEGPDTLPPLYAAWMRDALQGSIPRETEATCDDCVMLAKGGEAPQGLGFFFDPHTKCCTYIPGLPNFLVGRNRALRCPHYLEEEGGQCGIWRHRRSTCATWFCKIARLRGGQRVTLSGDNGYDTREFMADMRFLKVTPHVAQNTSRRSTAIDGRTTRPAGYVESQKKRKRAVYNLVRIRNLTAVPT